MEVAGTVALRFTGGPHSGSHRNLTAVRADGAHLWVAGDETPTLERLVLDPPVAPTRAGRQRSFRLADLVQLPGPATGETDIQGIARDGDWLWAIGSHALVRRRPKPEHDDAKVVRRLGKLRRDPNRYVIARLALQPGVDRHPEPVRVSRDGRRSALVGAPGAENLVDLLRADAHLAPFLEIPARDNGLDVQGIAAAGDRLFIGLRGPVLRGWAVVLEVLPVQDPTDPGRLALGIFPEGRRYRKHVLDLGGLGVRDLCPDGDDLLVLAGPTTTLSGPVRVHRWVGVVAGPIGPVVRDTDLRVETAVAHGDGEDHPEGITLLATDPRDPRARLLVVYDSPAAHRSPWPDTLLAERLRIDPEPGAVAGADAVGPIVEVATSPAAEEASEAADLAEAGPAPDPSDGDPTDGRAPHRDASDVEPLESEASDDDAVPGGNGAGGQGDSEASPWSHARRPPWTGSPSPQGDTADVEGASDDPDDDLTPSVGLRRTPPP